MRKVWYAWPWVEARGLVAKTRSTTPRSSNPPVTPHKATNEGTSGLFELHSWLRAEKQRHAGRGFQVRVHKMRA